MKKIVIAIGFLTLSLAVSAQNSKKKWHVTGNIQRPNTHQVYLYTIDLSRNKTLVDSAKVNNNTFEFSATTPTNSLQPYYFDYDKSKKGGSFFVVKNGDKLNIDVQPQFKSKFSGSKYANQLNSYFNIKQSEIDLLKGLMNIYKNKKLPKDKLRAEMMKFREKQEKLKQEKITKIKQIKLSDLKSYLVLEEALTSSILEKDIFQEYYNTLDNVAKNTIFGKKLEDIISHFNAYRLSKNGGYGGYKAVKRAYNSLSDKDKKSSYGIEVANSIKKLEQLGLGKTPPNITAKTVDGKIFNLKDVKSKVILIDFWASWCGPCRMENPHYKMLYNRLKNKGLTIIAYSLDTNKERWKKAIEKDGISWLNISNLKSQKSDKTTKDYQVKGIPANIVIVNGKIAARNLFGPPLDEFIFRNL